MLVWLAASTALAGYGDPVGGLPSPIERELHLWTNAVRVDPEAFIPDYPCDFESFQAAEKSPTWALLVNDDLVEAARFHSDDMKESGNFSHNSSDGTSFGARIDRFYEGGTSGENIAVGYPTAWSTVVEGWMCSSGHRANIMYPYEELGTGISGSYYTQDFGARGADLSAHPIKMGAHSPSEPLTQVTLLADWSDPFGRKTSRLEVVINGQPSPMILRYGTEDNGVWGLDLTVDPGPCYTYWFRGEREDGAVFTFPETGAYGWGTCTWLDADARWLERDDAAPTDELGDYDDGELREWRRWPLGGCQTGPGPAAMGWWLALALMVRARRPC
jgi:hypothetical protein